MTYLSGLICQALALLRLGDFLPGLNVITAGSSQSLLAGIALWPDFGQEHQVAFQRYHSLKSAGLLSSGSCQLFLLDFEHVGSCSP